ncbi:MAG: hypothetical protein A2283_08720 [Lentisphaerae bacterium RIFOXYA12_FULL_48_11]|nr:MAG: hypothetical protein A2283_08720 [Lentisphaerae bacterium RIFOXYA12_FULL_48_11]
MLLVAAAVLFHPPIGPYTHLKDSDFAGSRSFTNGQKIVFTPYFYWYDVETGAHIRNHNGTDALTTHPLSLEGFSFRSVSWHRKQLLDMMDAGIDVLLPVYWGEPSQRLEGRPVEQQTWSFAGLPQLVAAREGLVAEGKNPPLIGLFYDTSTLQWNSARSRVDLTTEEGRQWFYETIRDFFSLFPPAHWAMIDGRPVVFLYSAGFASAHDQICFDYLKESFARDFGGRTPFVVREMSWKVNTDSVYAWGGALGLKRHAVASLGPGYDHSAVPGRQPLIVSREDGNFYERNWVRFLRKPTNMVFLETWNEFHEGTDIAESREYGRTFITLTRKFTDMFRRGEVPALKNGVFTAAGKVEMSCSTTNGGQGVKLVTVPDGLVRPDVLNGVAYLLSVTNKTGGRYMYFQIDESFKRDETMTANVEVEYHDGGAGRFSLQFDGSDTNAQFCGAYTESPIVITLQGSNLWKTAAFRLDGARFANGENCNADFRIVIRADPFRLRRISVAR